MLQMHIGRLLSSQNWAKRPLTAVLILSMAACGGDGTPLTSSDTQKATTEKPSQMTPESVAVVGGTLVIARAADSATMDPTLVYEGESIKVVNQVYEGLLRFAPGSTEVLPALAKSWSSSEDRLVWTFNLREGVRFHDGTPFNAEAVVFTIKRQLDTDHPFNSGEASAVWSSVFQDSIESVEAVDELTLRVNLKKPSAPILTGFAVYSMNIVSPTAFRTHGLEWANTNGIGTGPFRFEQWTQGESISLVANDDYWNGRPYLDRIEFRTVARATERLRLLASGEVHVAEDLDNAALLELHQTEGVQVQRRAGLNVSYLGMNTTRKPFDDVRVRQAIAAAIDLSSRTRALFGDRGVIARNYVPPISWAYNSDVLPLRMDQAKARSLLAEAGYGEGFTFTLDVMENSRPYLPDPIGFAEGIRDDLAQVGITVELRVNPWQEHIDRLIRDSAGDYDAGLLGWVGDTPDPSDFLYVQFHSSNADLTGSHSNLSLYSNPQVDRALEAAQTASGQEERARLYREVQRILRTELPLIPIAHGFMILVADERVQDLSVPVAYSNYGLEKAWFKPAEEAEEDPAAESTEPRS